MRYLTIFCDDHPRGYKTYYLIPAVIWSAGVHSAPGNNTMAVDNIQEELPLVPEQNEKNYMIKYSGYGKFVNR